MAADRQPKMREMILSDTVEERRAALDELLPLQQQDFEEILEAMDGLPVTIRLLDPPLHEFLPPDEDDPRAHALHEVNPMLGTRGCRLAILHPEIYEMQVRAIMRAQRAVTERLGHPPQLEVMVPLIDYERELEIIEELIFRVAQEEGVAREDYLCGTMIELPRACFLADTIAAHADFFSFGTNDLTQTALGFSRDDIEGKILAPYIESKVFDRSPFETLDTPGRRAARADGRLAGPQGEAGAEARRLRRARRRPRLDRLLPQLGPGLRLLLAVSRAGGARGGRPGRDPPRRRRRLVSGR